MEEQNVVFFKKYNTFMKHELCQVFRFQHSKIYEER